MADFTDDFEDFGDFEAAPISAPAESRISDQDFEELLNSAISPPHSPQTQFVANETSDQVAEKLQYHGTNQTPEKLATNELGKVDCEIETDEFGDFEASADNIDGDCFKAEFSEQTTDAPIDCSLVDNPTPNLLSVSVTDVQENNTIPAPVEGEFPVSRKDQSIYPTEFNESESSTPEHSDHSSRSLETSLLVSPLTSPAFVGSKMSSDTHLVTPKDIVLSSNDHTSVIDRLSASNIYGEKTETASVSSSSLSTISGSTKTRYVDGYAHEADDEMSGFETSSTDQDSTPLVPSRKLPSEYIPRTELMSIDGNQNLEANDSVELISNSTSAIEIVDAYNISNATPEPLSLTSHGVGSAALSRNAPSPASVLQIPVLHNGNDDWQVEFTSFEELSETDGPKDGTSTDLNDIMDPKDDHIQYSMSNYEEQKAASSEQHVSQPLKQVDLSLELKHTDLEKSTLSDRRSSFIPGGFPGSDSDQETRSLRSTSDLSSSLEYQQGELVDLSEAHVAVYDVVDGSGTDTEDIDFGDFEGSESGNSENGNGVTIINRFDEEDHDIHINEDMISMAHRPQLLPRLEVGGSAHSSPTPSFSTKSYNTGELTYSDPTTLHPPLVFPVFSTNSPRFHPASEASALATQKIESPKPLTVQEILPEEDDFADFGDFETAGDITSNREQTDAKIMSASDSTAQHHRPTPSTSPRDDPKTHLSNDNKSSGNTTSATPLPFESEAATSATDDSEFANFDSFQEASSDATSIQSELQHPASHSVTSGATLANPVRTERPSNLEAHPSNPTGTESAPPKTVAVEKELALPQPVNPHLLSEASPVIEISIRALLEQHRLSAASRILDYTPSLDDVLSRSKSFHSTYIKFITQPQSPETASSLPTEPVLPTVQRDYADAPSILGAWFSLLKIENEQEIAQTENQRRLSIAQPTHQESHPSETKLRSKSLPFKPDDASASSSASDTSFPSDSKTRSESSSTPLRPVQPEAKGARTPPAKSPPQLVPSADLFDALDASLSLRPPPSVASPTPATRQPPSAAPQELDPLDFFFQSSPPSVVGALSPASAQPGSDLPRAAAPLRWEGRSSLSLQQTPQATNRKAGEAELRPKLRAWELSLPDYSFLLSDRIELAPASLL